MPPAGKLVLACYFFRLDRSSGGAERMMLGLANAMAARGHVVHLVSWDEDDAQAFYPIGTCVVWHRLGFAPGWHDKLRRTRQLFRLLRQLRCDVFTGFVMGADRSVLLANWLARVPVVAAERNSPDMYAHKLGPVGRIVTMAALVLVHRIAVQIPAYAQGYPAWLRSRIRAIPNPVEPAAARAQPAQRGGREWVLLCVARLEPQKNIAVLLDAFARVSAQFPEWRLRLVGEGSLRGELETASMQLGLGARVEFAGAVVDVGQEYVRAHLFCLPSRWEGFPNAMAEAMAHGLPAVGFAGCPGVNALVEHGQDGLLAEGNGDPASLSAALAALMTEPALRAEMGAVAVRSMQRYAPGPIFDAWEGLMRETAHAG